MRKSLLFLGFLLTCLWVMAQDAPTLIKEAEKLESELKEAAAYEKYKLALKADPRNYLALWKCSELCSRLGRRQATKTKQLDYYKAGKIFAETAIKVDPAKADGYYALSVAMGRMAMTESGNEKVKAVKAIKDYADKAIQIDPNHGRAWHVLGKWYYEVSNLNAVEKAALKVFYGGLPKASYALAIAAYEKAMKLEPNFALNSLELAKAYYKNGNKDKAIATLKTLPSIPEKTEDDKGIKEEGKALLEKWSKK